MVLHILTCETRPTNLTGTTPRDVRERTLRPLAAAASMFDADVRFEYLDLDAALAGLPEGLPAQKNWRLAPLALESYGGGTLMLLLEWVPYWRFSSAEFYDLLLKSLPTTPEGSHMSLLRVWWAGEQRPGGVC